MVAGFLILEAISDWWTDVRPIGPLQGKMDSAILSDFGNSMDDISTILVPPGTTIYEGYAGAMRCQKTGEYLLGGGRQIYIPKSKVNPAWRIK